MVRESVPMCISREYTYLLVNIITDKVVKQHSAGVMRNKTFCFTFIAVYFSAKYHEY